MVQSKCNDNRDLPIFPLFSPPWRSFLNFSLNLMQHLFLYFPFLPSTLFHRYRTLTSLNFFATISPGSTILYLLPMSCPNHTNFVDPFVSPRTVAPGQLFVSSHPFTNISTELTASNFWRVTTDTIMFHTMTTRKVAFTQ